MRQTDRHGDRLTVLQQSMWSTHYVLKGMTLNLQSGYHVHLSETDRICMLSVLISVIAVTWGSIKIMGSQQSFMNIWYAPKKLVTSKHKKSFIAGSKGVRGDRRLGLLTKLEFHLRQRQATPCAPGFIRDKMRKLNGMSSRAHCKSCSAPNQQRQHTLKGLWRNSLLSASSLCVLWNYKPA